MSKGKHFHKIAMLALAWFVFYVGASIAAPWVAPHRIVEICGPGGHIETIVVDHNGEQIDPGEHPLLCPLCLAASLEPPLDFQLNSVQDLCPAYSLKLYVAHIPALLGSPLPPRGPPVLHTGSAML